jgi:hypothetical protein
MAKVDQKEQAAVAETAEQAPAPVSNLESLNVYQRMHKVMEQIDYIRKTDAKKAGKGLQYNYVSHDQVTAAIRPHLITFGIYMRPFLTEIRQDGNRTELRGGVEFINVHRPDEKIVVEGLGYGVDQQDKGPGKSYSYLVKVCMLKAFALETGDREEVDAHQGCEADHQPARITEQQLADLEALAEEVGAHVQSFCTYLKINNLSELRAADYDRAIKALESKRAKAHPRTDQQ